MVVLVDVQELGGLDLRQPNRRDVAGVAPKRLVHRLVDALRLERHVFEGRLALHRGLADVAFLGPHAPVGELAGLFVFARLVRELDDECLGVGDDSEVGGENSADLGRFDVDVDELPSFTEHREVARHAVGPTVTDPHYEVRSQKRGVRVLLGSLNAGHSLGQNVVVGNCTPPHKGGDHWHSKRFRQVDEGVRAVGLDDAAAREEDRPLGRGDEVHEAGDLGVGGDGLVHLDRLVRIDVEIDLGRLHVAGKVDEDGARAALAHKVERLLEDSGDLCGLQDRLRVLRHRRGDRSDVDSLEVLFVELGRGHLTGDAQDGQRIGHSRVHSRDHVGSRGARRSQTHADVADLGARVPLGHVGLGLAVPGEDVADPSVGLQRGIQAVDCGAGDSECYRHPLFCEDLNDCVDDAHACHVNLLANSAAC